MALLSHCWCFLLVTIALCGGEIVFNNGGYENIVITIQDDVPVSNCREILENLESTLINASSLLHTALDGRGFFSSATVLLPDSWPNNCTARPVTGFAGLTDHIRIGLNHPVFGDLPWTQQSGGCGVQGDFISVSHAQLDGRDTLSGLLVQEWAKFRYGVFDESGFKNDAVYPICYQAESADMQVTGCSDRPITDDGVCNGENLSYDKSQLLHPEATTSLMFASRQGLRFCDRATHDRYAPTKHNLMCDRSSVGEVIDRHRDMLGRKGEVEATRTQVQYKRRTSTRYVLVIEDTQTMQARESWSYLRAAVRKFSMQDLPMYSELGLVLANETSANIVRGLSVLKTEVDRDVVPSNIPYTPGDWHAGACIHCALTQALQMLEDHASTNGPAPSVIILIAPGYTPSPSVDLALARAQSSGVYITTVTYPDVLRPASLDRLASAGQAFTVREQKINMHTSYLTTYFQLANTMFGIAGHFSRAQGMPIEIHRRELWEEGNRSVTGSFVLEESLSEPARFTVFTHDSSNPMIRSMSLVSPSQVVYSVRSDSLTSLKLITLNAGINETGTWSYTIDRYPGSPQPHFVQVLASPRSRYSRVVTATAWTDGRLVRATVMRGNQPVMGARVEVVATRIGGNSTQQAGKEKFILLDSGVGDPDVTKNDGVYSAYFVPRNGAGDYTFEVTASDNSNHAYSYQDQLSFTPHSSSQLPLPCCGSSIPAPSVRPISPFTRILPPLTATVHPLPSTVAGKIGDLRADILADQLKARLMFTAPDPPAKRYEVHYTRTLHEIVDNHETSDSWEHGQPFALAPGSDSTFTLDFTRNPSLLGKALYFCVEAYGEDDVNNVGVEQDDDKRRCSNWVRVLVPSPPPPPPSPTDYSYGDDSSWTPHAIIPSIANSGIFGLELILPVAGGIILLALCIAIYCYFCVLRRRGEKKKKKKQEKAVSTQPTIQIVPSSPPTSNLPPHFEADLLDHPDKKRSSVAPSHYEEKLVDDPIATITPLRQRTLSPYQSWTASQLLHEHERRQSPYGEVCPGQYNAPASVYGDNQSVQHYYLDQSLRNQYNDAPPVPPLPALNGIYGTAPLYGVQPGTFAANGYHRNGSLMQFNPSVQGSLSSVSSGDKKKRNVTMV